MAGLSGCVQCPVLQTVMGNKFVTSGSQRAEVLDRAAFPAVVGGSAEMPSVTIPCPHMTDFSHCQFTLIAMQQNLHRFLREPISLSGRFRSGSPSEAKGVPCSSRRCCGDAAIRGAPTAASQGTPHRGCPRVRADRTYRRNGKHQADFQNGHNPDSGNHGRPRRRVV